MNYEAKTIKELMEKYDQYRDWWMNENGSDGGFDGWFTKQIEALRPTEAQGKVLYKRRKGFKGFLYEIFGWDGIGKGDCRHEVGGICTYPKIYSRRGSCFSSTKCNFRPVFEPLGAGEYRIKYWDFGGRQPLTQVRDTLVPNHIDIKYRGMGMKKYNGWLIEAQGGFCTMKRYHATKGDKWHWAFLLRECKQFCDMRDAGGEIKKLYLSPLYI